MGRAAHRGSRPLRPTSGSLDRSREEPKGESFVDRPTSNLSQPDERRHVLLRLFPFLCLRENR